MPTAAHTPLAVQGLRVLGAFVCTGGCVLRVVCQGTRKGKEGDDVTRQSTMPGKADRSHSKSAGRASRPAALTVAVAALPPTVNHMYRSNGRGGRYLSDAAVLFRDLAVVEARDAANRQGWRVPAGALALTLRLTFGTNARADIDNRVKAALDALQVALDFDDSRVKRIVIEHAGYSKGCPACEMVLEAQQ